MQRDVQDWLVLTCMMSVQVWQQVEKIVGDLRATLAKKLRDPQRGLEEIEKTIE